MTSAPQFSLGQSGWQHTCHIVEEEVPVSTSTNWRVLIQFTAEEASQFIHYSTSRRGKPVRVGITPRHDKWQIYHLRGSGNMNNGLHLLTWITTSDWTRAESREDQESYLISEDPGELRADTSELRSHPVTHWLRYLLLQLLSTRRLSDTLWGWSQAYSFLLWTFSFELGNTCVLPLFVYWKLTSPLPHYSHTTLGHVE